MSQDHTLMASRFELKYLIPNEVALRVRQYVQQHLELDEFGEGQPNLSYPVHSLYLDSDDWKIYWRTVNGDKNRYKLRIRYYSDNPAVPVYFEIKRRMKDVILKQRCGVRHGALRYILAGHIPPEELIASRSAADRHALEEFIRLMLNLNARPRMHVAYDREAYVSPHNNEFRITMDRAVRAQLREDGVIVTKMDKPFVCTQNDTVILELKFTGRFPHWYRDLVQTFHCFQTGAAKFVEGTMMYAGRHLHANDVIRNMIL
jgi:SPX domain protein involved in polyphosphate accumulation